MIVIDRFKGQYRFLSNFYYYAQNKTTEHLYQSYKTKDPELRKWIRASPTPTIARDRGRSIALRSDWFEIRVPVMRRLLEIKFSIPWFTDKLLETGTAQLVEGNHWHDIFFGVCYCKECCGNGKNMLGIMLMEIREEKSVTVKRSPMQEWII